MSTYNRDVKLSHCQKKTRSRVDVASNVQNCDRQTFRYRNSSHVATRIFHDGSKFHVGESVEEEWRSWPVWLYPETRRGPTPLLNVPVSASGGAREPFNALHIVDGAKTTQLARRAAMEIDLPLLAISPRPLVSRWLFNRPPKRANGREIVTRPAASSSPDKWIFFTGPFTS